MEPSENETRPLHDALVLVLLGVVFLLPSFFTRDLWNPDEPRYMEVAREMVEIGGDAWIVPRLNGEVYPEKPPLFFWLAALVHMAGAGLLAGRVVAAAAAVLTLLATWLFARRVLGPGPGRWTAAVAATTVLLSDVAKSGVLDPLFALLTTAALFAGWLALHAERARGRLWLACYAAVGLAVLTKGHAALLVVGLPLLVYGIWNRRTVRGGGWWHAAGTAGMLGIVGAWLGAAWGVGGEDYVRYLTIGQLERRVVESESHAAGWHYYLVQYPLLFFPWFLLAVPAAVAAVRAWRRDGDGRALFALVWFAGLLVAFSAISGKREGYLLPLLPGFALLVGPYLRSAVCRGWIWPRADRRLLQATLGAGAVAALAATAAVAAVIFAPDRVASLPRFERYADALRSVRSVVGGFRLAAALAVPPLIGLVALLAARAAGRGLRAVPVAALAGLVGLASLYADVVLLPVANEYKSGRRFIDAALPHIARAESVYTFHDDFSGLYNLYTGRVSIPEVGRARRLDALLDGPERVAVIAREETLEASAPDVLAEHNVAARRRVGHRMMVLLTNWH